MPISIRPHVIQVRNENGPFTSIDAVTDATTAERLAQIQSIYTTMSTNAQTTANTIKSNFDTAVQQSYDTKLVAFNNAVQTSSVSEKAAFDNAIHNSSVSELSDFGDALDDYVEEKLGSSTSIVDAVALIQTDIAPVESSSTSENAYDVGDYLILSNKFYKVTAAITVGDTLEENTNIEETSIAAELKSLKSI